MSEHAANSTQQTQQEPYHERRLMVRYPTGGQAEVIRDSDKMRVGIQGRLRDISITGIGIILPVPLRVDEQVKVTLRNVIQRIEKETRGIVRHSSPWKDDQYFIGLELVVRLTPFELQLLKMGIPDEDRERKWL